MAMIMKKYLKYLGYGFLTLFIYCPIHISMAMLQMGLYYSFHDEIYGTFGTLRNPSVIIKIFVTMCVLYILVLLGFFLFGRLYDFSNGKILYAFILFIIPNFAFHILVNALFLADDFIVLLTWFFELIGDTFFFHTSIASNLRESRLLSCLFTYLPFIFTFLGGLTKRKKNQKKIAKENTGDIL